MDGVHDLGGTDGMGSINPTKEEPVFHTEWEAAVMSFLPITFAKGMWNIDEFRHAMERIDPPHYLDSPYYEHWLCAMEKLLVEKGVFSEKEFQDRLEEAQSKDDPADIVPEKKDHDLTNEVLNLIEAGGSAMREPVETAFKVGDQIKVKNMHPEGHTRAPEYVRRSQGEISEVRGTFVTPDSHAHGQGEQPQPVYSVRFNNEELWGEECADANGSLYIDLWEEYLEPV